MLVLTGCNAELLLLLLLLPASLFALAAASCAEKLVQALRGAVLTAAPP
jgi:hypothetical protein